MVPARRVVTRGVGWGMSGQDRLMGEVGHDLRPEWGTLGMREEQGLILEGQTGQVGRKSRVPWELPVGRHPRRVCDAFNSCRG